MSKRIRELAEQAYQLADAETRGQYEKWHTDKTLPLPTPFNEAYEQKFAGLIIRECINLCSDKWNGDADTYEASNAYNECAELIKEHFGVD